jgi:L-threonylcarbamoyladenylate synthase
MQTVMINEHEVGALDKAIQTINSGGIVAFPTDTVYGIGSGAFDRDGIQKLYEIKKREVNKAIAILLSDLSQFSFVCSSPRKYAELLGKAFWPGALTLVVPRHPSVPGIISPLPTIGVRIPDHAFAQALIHVCGPLAVTSANISGQPSPTNAQEVLNQLDGLVDLIINGGQSKIGISSTVVDCTGPVFQILRLGSISEEQIKQVIG